MWGTIVNSIAILAGGATGLILRKGLANRFKQIVMQGLGLAVLVIGISGALKSENVLLLIFSMVCGSFMGELMKIEQKLNRLGKWLESLSGQGEGMVAKGFVTSSLVYCVGAMAIVGALESGLTGSHQTLYAKSMLDGVSAIIFASTLGVGVLLSAISVFIYQGVITLMAGSVATLLTDAVVLEMSAVGGVLIMGISLNILEIRGISVGNMLPAIFIPVAHMVMSPLIREMMEAISLLF